MKLDKNLYPTEVAQILDIKKPEYEKMASNDSDILQLREQYGEQLIIDTMQDMKNNKELEQQRQMHLLRQTK